MTRIAIGFLALVALAAPAAAQNRVTGAISDPSGAVLPAVQVRASMKDANGETTRSVVTDGAGRYVLTDLANGTWTVTASLPGFTITSTTVSLLNGQSTDWNPTLRIGTLQETIMVGRGATAKRTEASRPPAPTTAAAAPARPAQTTPIRVGGNIKAPQKLVHVSPAYPEAAAAQGIQGVVILEATIGPNGLITDVRTLRSIPALDAAATDALRGWEFTPTLLNGQPVSVIMTATFQFTLN